MHVIVARRQTYGGVKFQEMSLSKGNMAMDGHTLRKGGF